MGSSVAFVKPGSLGVWPAILTLAVAFGIGGGAAGCILVHNDDRHEDPPPGGSDKPPSLDIPQEVAIEPDKALESTAGEGVGLYVEYQTGGHWRIRTTCDTNLSKHVCHFDAFVTPKGSARITAPQGEDLEPGDSIETLKDTTLHLSADTSSEFDAVRFDTEPGAIIELEAYFDDVPDARMIYWFGGGVLHTGAPTDPIDFKPSAP